MQDRYEIDVNELLAERKQIALIWGVEDVQEIRPDLNDDQAWEVLQAAERKHDATLGICWETLEFWAEDLFPEPDDSDQTSSV